MTTDERNELKRLAEVANVDAWKEIDLYNLHEACTPAIILSLIAEVERMEGKAVEGGDWTMTTREEILARLELGVFEHPDLDSHDPINIVLANHKTIFRALAYLVEHQTEQAWKNQPLQMLEDGAVVAVPANAEQTWNEELEGGSPEFIAHQAGVRSHLAQKQRTD